MEVLTSRSTFARGEMIVSPLISKQSVHVRDAFVKGIYGRTFEWIVKKINNAVHTPMVRSAISIIHSMHLLPYSDAFFSVFFLALPYSCSKTNQDIQLEFLIYLDLKALIIRSIHSFFSILARIHLFYHLFVSESFFNVVVFFTVLNNSA